MTIRKVIGRGDSPTNPVFVSSGSASSTVNYNITADGAQAPINTSSEKCISIQVSGTFNGTLTFQISNDQASWTDVCVKQVKAGVVASVNFNAVAGNEIYNYASEACFFRVVMSSFVSGQADVVICSSSSGCVVGQDLSASQLCNFPLVSALPITAGANAGPSVDLGSLFKETVIQLLLTGADTFTSASLVISGSVDGTNFVVLREFSNLTYAEVTDCLLNLDCDINLKYLQISLNGVVAPTGPDIQLTALGNHSN